MKADEAIAVNEELRNLNREIKSLERMLMTMKEERAKEGACNRIEMRHDMSYAQKEKPEYKRRIDAVLDEMRADIIRAAELGVERDLRLLKNRRRTVLLAFERYFDDNEKQGG